MRPLSTRTCSLCDQPHYGRGLCRRHLRRKMKPQGIIPEPKLCECGCGGYTPIATKTYTIRKEFKGQRRPFIPGHGRRIPGPDYLINENGCWVWQKKLCKGYGSSGGTTAHRDMYEKMVGKVPNGLDLDHLCRNRACVNPAHLEPVTRSENMKRSPLMSFPRLFKRKLSYADANEIRSSPLRTSELSRKYNVARTVICRIRNGKTYLE